MCKNLKNVILCVALSAIVLSSSSVYADDGASNVNTSVSKEEASDDSVVESDVAAETVEKFDIGASDVRRLMNLVGECDGFEIYSRDDDYKDKIQDRYGIKSDNTNSSTSKQQSESEKDIEILKKCGKLVAIDKNNIKVVAVFNNKKKCGENFAYISDAKRYTVMLSSDESKVIKVSEIVSSVDNPRLFLRQIKVSLSCLMKILRRFRKATDMTTMKTVNQYIFQMMGLIRHGSIKVKLGFLRHSDVLPKTIITKCLSMTYRLKSVLKIKLQAIYGGHHQLAQQETKLLHL